MGRAHHLKETLPQNILDNPPTARMDVEFVVLNYNSKDDLHEWITTNPEMKRHIESGRIRYGKTTDPEFFHMSHAKNMAHRMATGDVLCNLDADNFTGTGFARYLKNTFEHDSNIILNPSHHVAKLFSPDDRGFYGRIAISKENFMSLHGYDETFSGWGDEDCDLMQRAKGFGLKHLRIDTLKYMKIIKHSNAERVENMFSGEKRDEELKKVEKSKYSQESMVVKLFNKSKILLHPIQANSGGNFGTGNVTLANGQDLSFQSVLQNPLSKFNVCAFGLPELIRGRLFPRVAEDTSEKNSENFSPFNSPV